MSLIGDVSHSGAVSKNRNPGSKQLLFPNSVQTAPLDVVRLVLYWINDVQLARMREVSRTWNATILGDHRLNLRLVRNSCLF